MPRLELDLLDELISTDLRDHHGILVVDLAGLSHNERSVDECYLSVAHLVALIGRRSFISDVESFEFS